MTTIYRRTSAPEAGGWYKPPEEDNPVQLPALAEDIQRYEAKGYKFLGYVAGSLAAGRAPDSLVKAFDKDAPRGA